MDDCVGVTTHDLMAISITTSTINFPGTQCGGHYYNCVMCHGEYEYRTEQNH